MAENKEVVSSSKTEEIAVLEKKIGDLTSEKNTLLGKQKQSSSEEENILFVQQLSVIEAKIEEHEKQKTKLLQETQDSLSTAKPLSSEQKTQAENQIKNSSLSTEEQKVATEAIKTGEFDLFNDIGQGSSILSVFLAFFKSLFGGFATHEETDDNDFSVVPVKITEKQKIEFVKEAKIYALEVEQKYGIPWEVSLSQCILESGWGTSKSARKDGVYFGIKGKGVSYKTQEDYGNGLINITDEFKRYKNMRDAFHGYGEFLSQNPRYKPAFNYASQMIFGVSTNYQGRDPVGFIKEIKKAKYASDPNYVGKILSIQKGLEKIV